MQTVYSFYSQEILKRKYVKRRLVKGSNVCSKEMGVFKVLINTS